MKVLYPNFKEKALTFSYDDGVRQDIRLSSLFKKYGMSATFNLNSDSFGFRGHINHDGFDVTFDKVDKDEVKYIYSDFEIASHGIKHTNFDTLDLEGLKQEILPDIEVLEKLSGKKVVGSAYPCGRYNDEVIKNLEKIGIIYCRTINNTHNFSLPNNFLAWHPTCHDNDAQIENLIENFLENSEKELRLFYIWGHSFEFDKNDRNRWDHMESVLSKLAFKNDIWYTDNKSICKYINAVRMLEISENCIKNKSNCDIYLNISENIVLKKGEKWCLV